MGNQRGIRGPSVSMSEGAGYSYGEVQYVWRCCGPGTSLGSFRIQNIRASRTQTTERGTEVWDWSSVHRGWSGHRCVVRENVIYIFIYGSRYLWTDNGMKINWLV